MRAVARTALIGLLGSVAGTAAMAQDTTIRM